MKTPRDGSWFEQLRQALVGRIIEGPGTVASAERLAAFTNADATPPIRQLVVKVAERAAAITDDDFLDARRAGYTEDQLFEVVVCAAVGAATRQHVQAMEALRAAANTEEHASRNPR